MNSIYKICWLEYNGDKCKYQSLPPAVNEKFDFYCNEFRYKCLTSSVGGDQQFLWMMDVFLTFLLLVIPQETFSSSLNKRDTIEAARKTFLNKGLERRAQSL